MIAVLDGCHGERFIQFRTHPICRWREVDTEMMIHLGQIFSKLMAILFLMYERLRLLDLPLSFVTSFGAATWGLPNFRWHAQVCRQHMGFYRSSIIVVIAWCQWNLLMTLCLWLLSLFHLVLVLISITNHH